MNLVVEAKIREIFMPALSSTMTEGKIVAWNKTEGEKLTKGIVAWICCLLRIWVSHIGEGGWLDQYL